jgi:hypothetical protein
LIVKSMNLKWLESPSISDESYEAEIKNLLKIHLYRIDNNWEFYMRNVGMIVRLPYAESTEQAKAQVVDHLKFLSKILSNFENEQ